MDFDKTPYEEFFRYIDFSSWLNTGETIQSATGIVLDIETGTDQSATMISDVAVYAPENLKVIYKIKGGTSKKEYRIILRIVTTNAQKFEGSVHFQVK